MLYLVRNFFRRNWNKVISLKNYSTSKKNKKLCQMSRNTPKVWEMKLKIFSDFRGIGILLAFSALLFYPLQAYSSQQRRKISSTVVPTLPSFSFKLDKCSFQLIFLGKNCTCPQLIFDSQHLKMSLFFNLLIRTLRWLLRTNK